ncbi:hypothetical protein AVEN_60812-1 [Araneus ventricosus]|uniref:Uncharacterized protein n=1 Tax=Araneus ventricosus TaxID=182803 RepID=A0A4Y2HA06_ARAVE|nr:hypothetical protein AVEN_60812-1 [Araneus ventricosus]
MEKIEESKFLKMSLHTVMFSWAAKMWCGPQVLNPCSKVLPFCLLIAVVTSQKSFALLQWYGVTIPLATWHFSFILPYESKPRCKSLLALENENEIIYVKHFQAI